MQVRLVVPSSAEFNTLECPLDIEAVGDGEPQAEGSKVRAESWLRVPCYVQAFRGEGALCYKPALKPFTGATSIARSRLQLLPSLGATFVD